MTPLNILYLHSHDTGRLVQPYGCAVNSPNLQRLAEEGVLFRQAFCAAPTCSPSRAALLTGQSPHNSGMLGLAHRGFSLTDYRQHLLHTLKPGNYRATLIGMQHVAADPARIGYDQIVDVASAHARHVAPAAVDFLQNRPAEPFFLSVGFEETHRPFHDPTPAEAPRYSQPPPPLPDTPATRQDMAAFKASARILDEGIGAILNALDLTGLAGNTLVICTTDHGPPFPGMKCSLTDAGIGVMLIVRGPGGFQGGQVIDSLVSQLDIFPTLCDLLGLTPPSWLQGRSLLPLVRGQTDRLHDEIFAEVTYHAAYEPQRAIRTDRYKYIRRFEPRSGPVLTNCDDSPSKEMWLARGWRNRPPAEEQLYDLAFDPGETNNLANHPDLQPLLADLRARLKAWMQDTHDPLLAGPVPAPAGAQLNDPNGLSPDEPVQTIT